MNGPGSAVMTRTRIPSWRGRLFLGTGQMLYAGPVGPTSMHAHHAVQVVVSLGEPIALRCIDGSTGSCFAALIPPDQPHAIESTSTTVVLLYLDAQPSRVRSLLARRASATGDAFERYVAEGELLSTVAPRVLPTTWREADAAIADLLDALGVPEIPPAPLHPAVRSALEVLPALLDEDAARPSLARLARRPGISPSRLSHLFAAQVGIPLRPYVLWLRLQRAAAALAVGQSVTDAAHAAGFADAAHMTRVFRRMFGLVPSDVARSVEWKIRPSPSVPRTCARK